MGSNIAAGELAKDVDGAEQMIKEHNERKVCTAIVWHTCTGLYVITLICICSVISNPCKHVYVSYVLCVCHCIVCVVCVFTLCVWVCAVCVCAVCVLCGMPVYILVYVCVWMDFF